MLSLSWSPNSDVEKLKPALIGDSNKLELFYLKFLRFQNLPHFLFEEQIAHLFND